MLNRVLSVASTSVNPPGLFRAAAVSGVCAMILIGASQGTATQHAVKNGKFAFVRFGPPSANEREQSEAVFTVGLNGRGLRRITGWEAATDPSWSPDGRRLAFIVGGTAAVVITDDRGRGRRVLLDCRGGCGAVGVQWAARGSELVIERFSGPLLRIRLDGRRLKSLTLPSAFELGAALSPNGRLIAFEGNDLDGDDDRQLFVVGRDGSGLRMLTNTPDSRSSFPTWSPDGRTILFCRVDYSDERVGLSGLWVIRPDGGGPRRVIDDVCQDDHDWSPDGRRIAWEAQRPPGKTRIGILTVSSGRVTYIVTGEAHELDWQRAPTTR